MQPKVPLGESGGVDDKGSKRRRGITRPEGRASALAGRRPKAGDTASKTAVGRQPLGPSTGAKPRTSIVTAAAAGLPAARGRNLDEGEAAKGTAPIVTRERGAALRLRGRLSSVSEISGIEREPPSSTAAPGHYRV